MLRHPVIDNLGYVVGNAFEFLHDEEFAFEESTLTFKISDSILQNTPLEDLAIAYYDYDNNVVEILDTVYPVTGSAITLTTVTGSAITVEAVTGSELSSTPVDTVSGSAIKVTAASGSAITCNTISANVNHYSTYMVVNKKLYNNSSNINTTTIHQSSGSYYIRLSNGLYVRLDKNPLLGDQTVDSDDDGLSDIAELGFVYKAKIYDSSTQQYIYVDTWTFYTNPATKDSDKDGYNDNRDYRDNPAIYVDISKHSTKPYNMIMNGDNCFVDIHFNKFPYCTQDTKGEYVLQAEKWLHNLGLISNIDGKYEYQDIKAVAYLQKKYYVGSAGIIDNKTYWLLWALDDINKHKNDVQLGYKTQAQLDEYNASIMYQLLQPQYQNPDYTKDYYLQYYNVLLDHMIVGTKSLETVMTLFPGAEVADIVIFLNDITNYKAGDKNKIVADLLALGVDGAALYADEIIDVAKLAKKSIAKILERRSIRLLDNVADVALSNKVKNIRSLLTSAYKRDGNVGYATVNIKGLSKTEYYAHSGIHVFTGDLINRVPDISLMPIDPDFISLRVNKMNIVNGERAWDRIVDTEFKILDEISKKLNGRNVSGTITLFTELPPCKSCENVILQFLRKYPKIKIDIIHNDGVQLLP